MAFDLWGLEPEPMNSGLKGKTILIYGSNNLGKTYQASKLPKPLLMAFEPGGAAIKCAKQNIHKWSDAKKIWNQLCSEKMVDMGGERVPEYQALQEQKFQTIIIDTIEAMSDMCQRAVASEEGVSDISEIIGKKNGYSIFRNNIKTEINRLVSYGYTVIFISHAETVKKIDNHGQEIDFIQPRGWNNVKSELRFICDLCDFCFFVESNGVDEKTGNVIPSTAYTKETKRFFARSRFSEIPFRIEPFTAANVEETIKSAVEDTAKKEEAGVEEGFSREVDIRSPEDWVEDIKPVYKALTKHDKAKTARVVAEIIGEDNKISQCDDVVKLEQLYNRLDTLRKDLGV